MFSGCGQPRLGRKKRDASNEDEYNSWKNNKKEYVRPTTAVGTSLDRLVRDIKSKVKVAKDFWKDLPHSVCNEIAAPITEEHNCWNGLARGRCVEDFTCSCSFIQ